MNNKAPMSDEKRRFICRSSFLIFCLIPTCLVAYMIVHPFSASDWEQLIEAKLGLQASIDTTERTGPWTTILRGVTLQGDEPGDTASATEIKIVHGTRLEISIEQPVELTTRMAQSIGRIAGRKVFSTPKLTTDALVQVRQIKLSDEQRRSRLFHNVQWIFGQRDGAVRTRLVARTSPLDPGPANLEVFFEKKTQGQKGSVFHMTTSNEQLEGWVLAALVPEVPRFIDRANFSGEVEMKNAWNGQVGSLTKVQGFLMDVPLEQLEPSGGLSGTAKISIRECELLDGKVRRFDIEAACQEGSLSQDFIAFLEQDVRLQLANHVSRSSPIQYSEMMFRATLENGQLTLAPPGDPAMSGQTVMFGDSSEAIARWGQTQHRIDLCQYLLKPGNVEQWASTNRAVELLGHFDLPNPLPLRVGDRVADQRGLVPTPADPKTVPPNYY